MKKRLTPLLAACLLLFSLTACTAADMGTNPGSGNVSTTENGTVNGTNKPNTDTKPDDTPENDSGSARSAGRRAMNDLRSAADNAGRAIDRAVN